MMARREVVELIDDLDGKPIQDAGQTVRFGYDGVEYEIDLGPKNAKKLDTALTPFIEAGRRVGGRRVSRTTPPSANTNRGTSTDKARLTEIRSWARTNGLEVSDRGRVSQQVMSAYQDAH